MITEDEMWAEVAKEREIIYKKWDEEKDSVKDLIHPKYIAFAEDHDSFEGYGIIEINECDNKLSCSNVKKSCTEKGVKTLLTYEFVKTRFEPVVEDSEFEDEEIEYYVWQTTGYCGDDYSGYLLLPLNNGKFWKIGYSC